MATTSLAHLTAMGVARRIRDGDLTSIEVVDACFARIDEHNDRTNAFITVAREQARESAREADEAVERGDVLGPLHGVPVAIKDLENVEGMRTTLGSKLYEDQIADTDDVHVRRLRDAGAVIIGKTNTPEFGLGVTTDNLVVGPCSTPFAEGKVSGGSSGGAGAALGDHLVPLASGSDAGGSIRIPASCCGVYGLKPTFGLVPKSGRPNGFSQAAPFTHNGPMARTVEDAAAMLDVMAGPDPADPFSLPDDGTDYADATSRSLDGMKIAYTPDLDIYPVDPVVREVLNDAVEAFEETEADLERASPDLGHTNDEIVDAFYTFANVLWGGLIENLERSGFDPFGEDRNRLRPYLVDLIMDSEEVSMKEYRDASIVRTDVYDGLCNLFEEYDILVTSTLAVPPFDHGDYPEEIDGREIEPLRGWLLTQPFNFSGQPAASIPAGLTEDNLPIGMQIAGPRNADADVLAVSAAFERHRPWHDSYPNR